MTDEPPAKRAMNKNELRALEEAQLSNSVEADINQFRRLRETYPDLSDSDLAHRLVMTKKQLARVRKLLGE